MSISKWWALVGAVSIAVSGCSQSGPELRTPGIDVPSPSLLVLQQPDGIPMTIGNVTLCISTPGAVTITAVALHEATGNARVDAFAVRTVPATGLIGDTTTPLSDVGQGFVVGGPQKVSTVCPTAQELSSTPSAAGLYAELAIQITQISGHLAGGTGLDISYDSDGKSLVYSVPYAVWLCSGAQPSSNAVLPATATPGCL